MIEMIFIVVCSAIVGSWFIGVIILVTLADLKTINLEKALQRHPHARKWRGVTKLRQKFALKTNESFVPSTSERFSLARFQADPSIQFVEMIPRIEFPETVRGFFTAFHEIALTPFIKVRAVANIMANNNQWPILVRKKHIRNRMDKWYGAYVWLLQVTNLAVFLYVAYIALSADIPDYLMAYMSTFSLWLVWSITGHPLLVWRQKIVYLLLAPASFVYFLWRIFAAPFTPFRKITILPLIRRVLS